MSTVKLSNHGFAFREGYDYARVLENHQISAIKTFLLPQGKFRYTRTPMGLNSSSDEWCSRSDVVIEDLPWTRKIVDDILVWAEMEEELIERTRIILNRCKEHNIAISRKKLELGTVRLCRTHRLTKWHQTR